MIVNPYSEIISLHDMQRLDLLKENIMDVYLTIVDKELIDWINNGTYR